MGVLEQLGLPVETLLSFVGIVVILIAGLRYIVVDKDSQLSKKENEIEKLEVKLEKEQDYNLKLTERVLTQSAKTDNIIEGLTRVIEAMKP